MTSAFQVNTTSDQALPKFDYELWDGTNQASLVALLKRATPTNLDFVDLIVAEVGQDGELIFTAPYFRFVMPAATYLVLGPYWGGEWFRRSGGPGELPYRWINAEAFANRFPNA